MDDAGVSTQSCAQCRAPMADDQRYCLQCGEPRFDVKSPLASGPVADTRTQTPSTAPGVPVTAPSISDVRDGTSARNNSVALIAGVGVLLLAMGVGVLIGRAGTGSAKTPSPQVITVGGGGATGAGTTGTSTARTPEATKAPSKGKVKKEEEESKAPPGTGNSLSKPAPPSTLKNLRKGGSGKSYEQRSKNLPNVVGT
jgi:hypothetical protein